MGCVNIVLQVDPSTNKFNIKSQKGMWVLFDLILFMFSNFYRFYVHNKTRILLANLR